MPLFYIPIDYIRATYHRNQTISQWVIKPFLELVLLKIAFHYCVSITRISLFLDISFLYLSVLK